MASEVEALEPVSPLAHSVCRVLEKWGGSAPTVFRIVRKEFGLTYTSGGLLLNELIGHLNSQSDYSAFDDTLYAIEGLINAETNEWMYI